MKHIVTNLRVIFLIITQLLIYLLIFFWGYTNNLYAQWSTDPYNNLIVGYGLLPEIASDSAGGCYITYEQNLGYPRRLILERLNRYGYKPWGSGRRILGEFPEQSFAKITEDGQNGVIVSYLDYDGDNWPYIRHRLRVQRVDSSGNFLWGTTGVRVTISETNQGDQAIVSDGQGGCIVAWVDTLQTLIVQRINSTGNRIFGDTGVVVTTGIQGHPYSPILLKSFAQNFYIGYSSTIFSQQSKLAKFSIDGNLVWPSELTLDFLLMNFVHDFFDGVICSGRRSSSQVTKIVCQRIDSDGVKLWGNAFLVLADSATPNNAGIPISSTGDGGGIFCWTKIQNDSLRLFAKMISASGEGMWNPHGVYVSRVNTQQQIPKIIGGIQKSSIFIWTDSRFPRGFYTQRLDSASANLWDSTDVPLTIRNGNQVWLQATSDGAGGGIAVWYEEHSFAIFAQQVNKYGKLGEVITSIVNLSHNLPSEFFLYQNYPNPFNPVTVIKYDLPISSHVTLKIYDVLGREVTTLVNEYKEKGFYEVSWNAQSITSAVYFYKLVMSSNEPLAAGSYTSVKKMLLSR